MSKRIKIEVPMNEIYKIVKSDEGNKKVINSEGNDVNLVDKLSNTYPRPIKTIIGKINCVENGLIYMISNTMRLTDVRKPYPEIRRYMKNYIRRSHHVPYYNMLELILVADSVLSDKNLVVDILSYEDFEDFKTVDLIPVIRIKSGMVKTTEHYHTRKSLTRAIKKVIWEIKNAFADLEDAYRNNEELAENEKLSPETIRQFDNEAYKTFKNAVKETLADIIAERIKEKTDEDVNILEGIRGAEELKLSQLKDIWLR